jgi:protein ImuB
MFACVYLPPSPDAGGRANGPARSAPASDRLQARLVDLAREFSPRVETHGDRLLTFDISGLGTLVGSPRTIGEELRRAAAERGLPVHVAIAATQTTAILMAQARAGLTVVPPGQEAAALAPLPLTALARAGLPQLARWGLRTLGDLVSLPAAGLSERLGQEGVIWQRLARGEDVRPLVPSPPSEVFEESLDLEWPIEGLEPLSFVLGRLCEPLCARLERGDRGAVAIHLRLTLVTRQLHERSVSLPAPMRDARVLRTLAMLDIESHPPPAAIDRVTMAVDVTEGRILQFTLFTRALPAERLSTLLARLGALMGAGRVGAPALVDSHRPGAFAMTVFAPGAQLQRSSARASSGPGVSDRPEAGKPLGQALRRFRLPIPARVVLEQDRPIRVVTDRRGFGGGRVELGAGPWRASGDWWGAPPSPWGRDEWDVVLSDGTACRICHAGDRDMWFLDGLLD